MEGMEYFYELYEGMPRGGPGDNASTAKAYSLMDGVPPEPLILDIGCGPGMQTLELARISSGKIIALDNHRPFLDKLMESARSAGLTEHITAMNRSMLEMEHPRMGFELGSFDVIWSEGALYFMGFGNGLRTCRPLLKDGGYVAVTEAVYLKADPPEAVVRFWEDEYPDISDVEDRIELIGDAGFRLISHFTLPRESWFTYFYDPMRSKIAELTEKYMENELAVGIYRKALDEIGVYERYSDHFGYEFFVMRKE